MRPIADFQFVNRSVCPLRKPTRTGLFLKSGAFGAVERHGAGISLFQLTQNLANFERFLGTGAANDLVPEVKCDF